MRVLVTGGCGYIGSVLVPKLIAAGHTVLVHDIGWFGHESQALVWRGDIRDLKQGYLCNTDAVIHLAAVANDPTCELDGRLAWEVNALGTLLIARMAAECGIRQFIYASSGSVYGVSDAPNVKENAPLVPISDYNKTKAVAERCVLSYADRMTVQIVRPATVCGYSPRMRLDVVVNRYTMQALKDGVIEVWGGEQTRPHIHIDDMTDLYLWMLTDGAKFGSTIWNAGFENLSLTVLAQMIAEQTGARVVHKPSNDPRSYRLDSSRLLQSGFTPKKCVSDAIREVASKIRSGELKDEMPHYNLKVMRGLQDEITRV